jgi:hypothetical protein
VSNPNPHNPLYGGVLNVVAGQVAAPHHNNPPLTVGNIMTGAASQGPATPEITHLEIRRVQNGFVVMAININEFEARMGGMHGPKRWSFVAKDTTELGALIESIVTGAIEMKWVPSYDLPIVDLFQRKQPG